MVFNVSEIGKTVGQMAAQAECDISEDHTDAEARARLREASEIYKNFAQAGFPGFHEDFVRGFEAMMPFLYPDSEPQPSCESDQAPEP